MFEALKDPTVYRSQWPFQIRYATGKILNVGCNNDGGKYAERGAINVDLCLKDECNGQRIPAHVLADARFLPFKASSFDTVVLGEILEHMNAADAVNALCQAKAVLKTGGRIVATIPHDDRKPQEQGYGGMWDMEYYPGISRYHSREITRFEFFDWMKKAGLKIILWGQIFHMWGKQ